MEIEEKVRIIEKAIQEAARRRCRGDEGLIVLPYLPSSLEQEINRKVMQFVEVTCILEGWKQESPKSIKFDNLGRICIEISEIDISLPYEIFLYDNNPASTLYQERINLIDSEIEIGLENVDAAKKAHASEEEINYLMEELGEYLEIKESLDKVLEGS